MVARACKEAKYGCLDSPLDPSDCPFSAAVRAGLSYPSFTVFLASYDSLGAGPIASTCVRESCTVSSHARCAVGKVREDVSR